MGPSYVYALNTSFVSRRLSGTISYYMWFQEIWPLINHDKPFPTQILFGLYLTLCITLYRNTFIQLQKLFWIASFPYCICLCKTWKEEFFIICLIFSCGLSLCLPQHSFKIIFPCVRLILWNPVISIISPMSTWQQTHGSAGITGS